MERLDERGSRPRRGGPTRGPGSRRPNEVPNQARLLALRVLHRVERAGAYADLALHAGLERTRLAARDRAFATELVYGTLRWRGRIDFVLGHVLDRDLGKIEPAVATVLRLGAYQLLFCDRVPASAAVSESVRCARAAGLERATGLVNAVLRRLAEAQHRIELPRLEDDAFGHLAHALSLPGWLAERWIEAFGAEEAAALAGASNQVPPHTVRTNRLRTTRAELLSELCTRFPDAAPGHLAPDAIVLGRRGYPAGDPGFLDGRFTIQDEGAQLVVELLDPKPGERVLDACAAPGAKATAIAERVAPEGHVLGLDRHARRLRLLERDARRLGLENVRTREADATRPLNRELAGGEFDRVLVDAPCSGLGTLRRNPEVRWRVGAEDPARLALLQRALLIHVSGLLRVGGVLVYSTCTLTAEENEGLMASFLGEAPQFRRTPREELAPGIRPLAREDGSLVCLPHVHDTDGFFAVRLERCS